jgi:hypothetical protein
MTYVEPPPRPKKRARFVPPARFGADLVAHPIFDPYREVLEREAWEDFPSAEFLTRALATGLTSYEGHPLRFVDQTTLPTDLCYETHIARTGEVPTRPACWHDLCGALVWHRFPRSKAVFNRLHDLDLRKPRETTQRSRLRDALTRLDEGGALIVSHDEAALERLKRFEWWHAFEPALWASSLRLYTIGHAVLEQCAQPFMGVSVQAVHAHVTPEVFGWEDARLVPWLDEALARFMEARGEGLARLRPYPTPVLGVPGFWGDQTPAFYEDAGYFRPPKPGALDGVADEDLGHLDLRAWPA